MSVEPSKKVRQFSLYKPKFDIIINDIETFTTPKNRKHLSEARSLRQIDSTFEEFNGKSFESVRVFLRLQNCQRRGRVEGKGRYFGTSQHLPRCFRACVLNVNSVVRV